MRTIFLFAVLVLSISVVRAAGDVQSFTLAEVDARLAPIFAHAANYPPKFDSAGQRTNLENDLHALIMILDKAHTANPADREILKRRALANSLGHNLDFPSCAAVAMADYEALLEHDPADGQTQFLYGGFLAGTTEYARSIPHLLSAIRSGISDAHFTLAFVFIKLRQPDNALTEFKEYLQFSPGNETAKAMVRRIEEGQTPVRVQSVPFGAAPSNAR